ncbi:MAG: hypothetical protein WA213_21010 [Terriglobales bacterium]
MTLLRPISIERQKAEEEFRKASLRLRAHLDAQEPRVVLERAAYEVIAASEELQSHPR